MNKINKTKKMYIVLFTILFSSLNIFANENNEQVKDKILPENKRIFYFAQNIDRKELFKKERGRRLNAIELDKARKGMKENIDFIIKMPKNWSPQKEKLAEENSAFSIRGVLCVPTYIKDKEDLDKYLIKYDTSKFKYLLEFADKENLAIVTWTNLGGYSISQSADEMSKEELNRFENIFNQRVEIWERGFLRVLNIYHLPKREMLMFGSSGGAQNAHRLAFRKPKYFAAIHIHVNSSYDKPVTNAKNILWLVTTGELEYGYPAGARFYKDIIDMGYPVIFKAGENLGHNTNAQIDNLSIKFFEYALHFIPDYTDKNWKTPPVDRYYLIRNPDYIGDYLNQVAYTRQEAIKNIKNRKYMVPLPTKEFAKAWGTLLEK